MKRLIRGSAAALFFACAAALAQNPVLSVSPAHPQPSESVDAVLHFPVGGCVYDGTFALVQDGRNLRITQTWPPSPLILAGACNEGFTIGALVAGRYQLEWNIVTMNNIFTFTKAFIVGDGGPPEPVPTLGSDALMALLFLLSVLSLSQINTKPGGRFFSGADLHRRTSAANRDTNSLHLRASLRASSRSLNQKPSADIDVAAVAAMS